MTSRRPTHHRARTRRGTSAVEFALVSPVLLLFVFGLIEFGRMLSVEQAVTNAAREGCRKAVLATTTSASAVDATVRTFLDSIVPDAADVQKVRVTVTPQSFASLASATEVTVDVEVNYSDVSWFPVKCLNCDPVLGGSASQKRE